MKNKIIHIVLAIFTSYLFWIYVSRWQDMMIGEPVTRPFVYRVLVPFMVQVLVLFQIPRDISYMLVIGMSFVGLIWVTSRLCVEFIGDEYRWVLSMICSWGLLFFIYVDSKSYDVTTAFLMSLSILLIYKNKYRELMLLFPFLCLNRETAFLVTILCAIWYWRKIDIFGWMYMLFYQGAVFLLIQSSIRIYYHDLPDISGITIFGNIQLWSNSWDITITYLLLLVLILYLVLVNWADKPEFLKTSFTTIFPIVFGMYLVFGWGYETRVFAEVYPIVALLSAPAYSSNSNVFLMHKNRIRV